MNTMTGVHLKRGSSPMVLAIVGDSDVYRWPAELYPSCEKVREPPFVRGHSGATLEQVVPHVKSLVEQFSSRNANVQSLILVACAGENDIGNAYSVAEIMESFERLLVSFFTNIVPTTKSNLHVDNAMKKHLIFLGPKIEPWLEDDSVTRKMYIKLANAMRRACEKHACGENINFIDCLTLFCGESGALPGALFGGRAKAEFKYFIKDQLHLNDEGYRILKDIVEQHVTQILRQKACKPLGAKEK